MQRSRLHIINKLGKIRDLLKVANNLPECNVCTDVILKSQLEVEDLINEIGKQKVVDWSRVSVILEILTRFLTVLNLLGLKDF